MTIAGSPMRIRCPIPLPSCLAAVALFLGGCSGEPTTPVADPVPEDAIRISVRDDFFSPSPQTVNAGQSIVWVWTGSNQHTVRFENLPISSGSAKASGSFAATLSASGSFTYYCEVHGKSVMSGTITVSGAGSGSGGTNTGGDSDTGGGYP